LIGAPIPKVPGRKRQDDTVGLIILGENGADRVALSAPGPNPQINGRVSKRVGAGAGLLVDDSEGNERGGFGVLDNDSRVTLGLDYPGGAGEALPSA
jgi:isoaspartyl peptidase/L-asparaginase-like protein (Ntn-hydrolase superfamily)